MNGQIRFLIIFCKELLQLWWNESSVVECKLLILRYSRDLWLPFLKCRKLTFKDKIPSVIIGGEWVRKRFPEDGNLFTTASVVFRWLRALHKLYRKWKLVNSCLCFICKLTESCMVMSGATVSVKRSDCWTPSDDARIVMGSSSTHTHFRTFHRLNCCVVLEF